MKWNLDDIRDEHAAMPPTGRLWHMAGQLIGECYQLQGDLERKQRQFEEFREIIRAQYHERYLTALEQAVNEILKEARTPCTAEH